MIHATENNYRSWQTHIKKNRVYHYWWQFWSNYAFIFFIPAFAWIGLQPYGYEVIGICALTFFTIRFVVIWMINQIYQRERPYQKYKFTPHTSVFFSWRTAYPNSFPSRHTATYAAVAFAIFAFFPMVGLPLIGITIITGIARVILGYHFPSDIAAGLVIGALTGLIIAWAGPLTLFT